MYGLVLSRLSRLTRRALPHVSHALISLVAEGVLEAQSEGGTGDVRAKRALEWTVAAVERLAGRDLVNDKDFVSAVMEVQKSVHRLYRVLQRSGEGNPTLGLPGA